MKTLILEVTSPNNKLLNDLKRGHIISPDIEIVHQKNIVYKDAERALSPELWQQFELLAQLTGVFLIQIANDVPKEIIANMIAEWFKKTFNKKDASVFIYGKKPNDGSGIKYEYRKKTKIDLKRQTIEIEEFLKERT